MPGSKLSNAPENDSFVVSFISLELRREYRKDYMKVGQSRQGLGYRTINKITCFLEGSHACRGVLLLVFQRCVNLDAQEQ